jgi:hypothetical protein
MDKLNKANFLQTLCGGEERVFVLPPKECIICHKTGSFGKYDLLREIWFSSLCDDCDKLHVPKASEMGTENSVWPTAANATAGLDVSFSIWGS